MRLLHCHHHLNTFISRLGFAAVACLLGIATLRQFLHHEYVIDSSPFNNFANKSKRHSVERVLEGEVTKTPKIGDESEAIVGLLWATIRILCIVQTTASKHLERAVQVKATWGRRCTKLVFASDQDDQQLPAFRFAQAGREYVTFKIRRALQWAYDNELEGYDWFLKADDDTYIVMENLLAFLSNFSPKDDHYFGRPFAIPGSRVGRSFTSGSAYILSQKTLRRLVDKGFRNPDRSKCPTPMENGHEDVDTGYCLYNIGVQPEDTRDEQGRHRFLAFAPWVHLYEGSPDAADWIRNYDRDAPYTEGAECCSDTVISMHYLAGNQLLAMEYFLYRVRSSVGSHAKFMTLLPHRTSNTAALGKILKERGYNVPMRLTGKLENVPFFIDSDFNGAE